MDLATIKLLLIILTVVAFIYLMMTKKISALLALPMMGVLTALVASIDAPMIGLFNWGSGVIDETTGAEIINFGIFNGVIGEGTKMMASAISAAVFGAAFAKLLNKHGVAEKIIKTSAELAGDRPLTIAISFFIATVVIFAAIGGLGAVILVGSVSLPIMMTAGITPITSASIVLMGLSVGGVLNAANYATFAAILAPTLGGDTSAAYNVVAEMSLPIFIITFIVGILFIVFSLRNIVFRRTWSQAQPMKKKEKGLHPIAMLSPLVPVLIIMIGTFTEYPVPAEVAITAGIVFLLFVANVKRKLHSIVSAFVEGTQDVAGAIVLLIGLGILIKGFQFHQVTPIIQPAIESFVSLMKEPLTYVIGFTIATPLVLYRGPLNTFGIGGALPTLFAAAGFSPIATIWALRSTGMLQGFGDPTNSQNIWIADFVQVDPNEITKQVFLWGVVMSFLMLIYAVFINGITLIA
ncbi:MAG: transporter [Bacilli bacterium]